MKTHNILCSASLLLVGLIATSCNNDSKKVVENEVTFDSISVSKTVHLLDKPENPNCNLQINFKYPVKVKEKELLKQIQQHFVASYFGEEYEALSPEEAVSKYTEAYLSSYKELESDYTQELEESDEGAVGSWFSYYETSDDEIVYNQNNLLSYVVTVEGYTGGAHGAHSSRNQTINLATGKVLTEEDIFIEDYQEDLAKILVSEIASQNSVADSKELENIGFFSIDEIYPNKNFYVNDKGLVYTFNEYEIAAYAVGAITVQLPFEQISHILKKEGPVAAIAF